MTNICTKSVLLAFALALTSFAAAQEITKEWTMWGGDHKRNNTPVGENIPTEWEVGEFDPETGEWDSSSAKNIKWVARLGSQTYGNVVVAGDQVYVGTNNGGGWIERYPFDVDLGVLLAFDRETGEFRWQHSSEKLTTGRVHDWPEQGICSASYVEGDRLWFVTSRGELRCLDTKGFRDGKNDGPYQDEPVVDEKEADVLWVLNFMEAPYFVSQHNMCNCSVFAIGDVLFLHTSNGLDESHINLPSPDAPSFMAVDKNTGDVLWTDKSPGSNILHGQWSSPTYAVIDGQPQVLFAGGDGWMYSFDPAGDGKGNSKMLWKFDANPKESEWILGGRGTRNNIIATPVVYNDLVYFGVGQDPEHGEGIGHLWCIDPTKRGNISPELTFNSADPTKEVPHKRIKAVLKDEGDFVRPNPNSGVVWHYSEEDSDGDGEVAYEETMHRTVGTVAIKDDVLYIADLSGLVHCMDAKTGKKHWTYDMLAQSWGSPLIVEGKVYIGDEDGQVAIFRHSADPNVAMKDDGGEMVPYFGEVDMGNSVYSTPIVADNILYISNRTHLFAIEQDAKPKESE
jgi:outer membrane protein assembly factor BamB